MNQYEALDRIEDTMEKLWSVDQNKFLILIGGDHAVTAPAARAFAKSHKGHKMGLIHFDAHNDVRVMDHGPTNGTPIRQLMESGLEFDGKNLVQVGIHGFMNSSYYKRWVEGHGGTIFTGRHIRQNNIIQIAKDALEIAGNGTDSIYITVDIDGLDPKLCPNTGTPVPGGLEFEEAVHLIRKVVDSGRTIIGFDLVEVKFALYFREKILR